MQTKLELIKSIGKIKKVKRSGWVREKINNPESVADHSYRLAVMAMILGKDLHVNVDKLMSMVLLHDLGEGLIGDVVAQRGAKVDTLLKEEKDKEKIEKVREMFKGLKDGNVFSALQEESLKMESKEAIILKQLEALEMAIQALEYEEETGKDLTEFFNNATMRIEDSYLKEMLEEVKSSRSKKA